MATTYATQSKHDFNKFDTEDAAPPNTQNADAQSDCGSSSGLGGEKGGADATASDADSGSAAASLVHDERLSSTDDTMAKNSSSKQSAASSSGKGSSTGTSPTGHAYSSTSPPHRTAPPSYQNHRPHNKNGARTRHHHQTSTSASTSSQVPISGNMTVPIRPYELPIPLSAVPTGYIAMQVPPPLAAQSLLSKPPPPVFQTLTTGPWLSTTQQVPQSTNINTASNQCQAPTSDSMGNINGPSSNVGASNYSADVNQQTSEPSASTTASATTPGSTQNGNYAVHVHIYAGETLSVRVGTEIQYIQGPATVRMVSAHMPRPLPLHVPPGHTMHQLADDQGQLHHIILTPQSATGQIPPLPTVNLPCSTATTSSFEAPTFSGPPPASSTVYQSPETQVTYRPNRFTPPSSKTMSSKRPVMTPDDYGDQETDGDGRSGVSAVEDDQQEAERLKEMLDRVQPVTSKAIGARHVTLVWQPLDTSEASAPGGPYPHIDASEFTYEILLSEGRNATGNTQRVDKSQATERSFTPTVKDHGLNEYNIEKLKPATEYSVRLRAYLHERDLQGSPSRPHTFRTRAAAPEQPLVPRVGKKTTNSVTLMWRKPCDNGAPVRTYLLEMAEQHLDTNHASTFHEAYKGPNDLFKLTKLCSQTTYMFRLSAENENGQSLWSDILYYQTGGTAPLAPAPPQLAANQPNAIQLFWSKRPGDESFKLEMEDPHSGYGYRPCVYTSETTALVTDLRRYEPYNFRLVASNSDGDSTPSDPVTFTTAPTEPSAPTKLIVKERLGSSGVRLTWQPPKDNGGYQVELYSCELTETTNGNNNQIWSRVYEGRDCSCVLSSLEPGHAYLARVSAANDAGWSPYTNSIKIKQAAEAPGACPQPELAGKPKCNQATIRWNGPEQCGGAEVTDFDLWLSASNDVDSMPTTSSSPFLEKLTSREQQLSALVAGVFYNCAVRACNSAGTGAWSSALRFQTAFSISTAPRNLTIEMVDSTEATIRWEEPEFVYGSPVNEYRLHTCHADEANTPFDKFTKNAASSKSIPAKLSNLMPFTNYLVCVTAVNGVGESEPSQVLMFKTAPGVPAPPKHLVVEAMSTSELKVRWESAEDGGSQLTAFAVHCQNEKNRHDEMMMSTDADSNELRLGSLKPETQYRIRVRASNTVGHSSFSNPVVVSTLSLPPPPPLLELLSTAHNQLKLKWTDVKAPCSPDESYSYTLEMQNKFGTFSPVYDGAAKVAKIPRLCESSQYMFRVRCVSTHGGAGPWSEPSSFNTCWAAPPGIKSAPRVTQMPDNTWHFEWSPHKANVVPDKLVYVLEVGPANSSPRHHLTEDWKQAYEGYSHSCSVTLPAMPSPAKARVITVRLSPHAYYKFPTRTQGQQRDSISDDDDDTASTTSQSVTGMETVIIDNTSVRTLGAPSAITVFNQQVELAARSSTEAEAEADDEDDEVLAGVGFSERQWAMVIMLAFCLIAVMVAVLMQVFVDEPTSSGPAAAVPNATSKHGPAPPPRR